MRRAADRYPDVDFVYPVHLNPKVQKAAAWRSGDRQRKLIEPLPYVQFVETMATASVIVTDSGGVQEEAPSLGIPVLVLRKTTERPEALEAGANPLMGTLPTTSSGPVRGARRPRGRELSRSRDPIRSATDAPERIVETFSTSGASPKPPGVFLLDGDNPRPFERPRIRTPLIASPVRGPFHEHA